ncbi:MAG: hypothetical protein ACRCYQ_04925 [Nocardioides sp.]
MRPEGVAGVPHAWVDESVHVEAGLYVLAAVVADPTDRDMYYMALRAHLQPSRRRLHWRDEKAKERVRIAETVATLGLAHVAVVASGLDLRRQERGRRKCLERLLVQLSEDGAGPVWFESRGRSLDRHDLAMVTALRTQLVIPRQVQVDFARPLDEPMLWIPDAVAGAVAAERKGNDSYRAALGSNLVELDIKL